MMILLLAIKIDNNSINIIVITLDRNDFSTSSGTGSSNMSTYKVTIMITTTISTITTLYSQI